MANGLTTPASLPPRHETSWATLLYLSSFLAPTSACASRRPDLVPGRPGVRCHRLVFGQRKGRVHQRKVTERLRKVAELAVLFRVVLLGEQSEIVGRRGHFVEQPSSILFPAHHLIDRDEPERAGEEYPFVAGKAVDVRFGLEPKEQPIPKKLALERRDGADDARIGCRQEAAQRYEQQAGVQSRAPVVLREAVELRVEPIPAHLRENGSTSLAKVLHRLV